PRSDRVAVVPPPEGRVQNDEARRDNQARHRQLEEQPLAPDGPPRERFFGLGHGMESIRAGGVQARDLGEGLVRSAYRALLAVDTAVEFTHDRVHLAALEVVDMHVGRPAVLPGNHQELWLEMRDGYARDIWRATGPAKDRHPGL